MRTGSPGSRSVARALPGAVDFANYAASKDVPIYFVTNRDAPAETESTIANLRALGFPIAADASNVLLRGDAPRTMNREQLIRYLDCCADMLAMIGKLAALHAERMRDAVVMETVTEIESLTTDLARKIWHKIEVVDAHERGQAVTIPLPGSVSGPPPPKTPAL